MPVPAFAQWRRAHLQARSRARPCACCAGRRSCKGDEDAWLANTKKFTDATGVEVRVDKESWEDIRPKAAVAANVGSGPGHDAASGSTTRIQYPDKLLDVTELGTYLGEQVRRLVRRARRLCASATASSSACRSRAIGNAIVYRDSHGQGRPASTSSRRTPPASSSSARRCKAKGTPAGFPHGKAVGDGNNYAHWLLWSHGGKMVDESGKVAINSPETLEALEYAKELYQTFIPGTESWLDVNNNRAFLAGEVSVTANGVSLYYAAKNDPKLAEIAKDIRTTNLPIGPVGKSVELHQTTSAVIFNYTKYPKRRRPICSSCSRSRR